MSENADRKQHTGVARDAAKPGDHKRREISGPGAADFLAAPGGVDMPESDPSKGTRGARGDEGALVGGDSEGLAPQLDERERGNERRWESGVGMRRSRTGGKKEEGGRERRKEEVGSRKK